MGAILWEISVSPWQQGYGSLRKESGEDNKVRRGKGKRGFRGKLLLAGLLFFFCGIGTITSYFTDYDGVVWRFFVEMDKEPPSLTVITPAGRTPEDPTYAVSSSYLVSGNVSDDKNVQKVTVNGREATRQDSGSWWCSLSLEDGMTHQIQVEAVDGSGNRVQEILYVRYDSAIRFEDFTVTLWNRKKIGYTADTTELQIPETFYDEETATWYHVVAIGFREGDATNTTHAAFAKNTKLTSVTIPGSVKKIYKYSFYQTTGITQLSLGYGIEMIGSAAFQGCMGLTQMTLPDSINELGATVFMNCKKMTSINLPKGLTELYSSLFTSCIRLTGQMVIPEGVQSVGENVFLDTEITSIVIPASVKSIGLDAFRECTMLTDVYYGGTPEQWAEIYFGRYNEAVKNARIHYEYQY